MHLLNELSCEARSFFCRSNPSSFLTARGFEVLFPALELWVAWSVLLPSFSSWFISTQMWDHQPLSNPPGPQPPCCMSSPPWLPISAPPTGLDESFFFNSLVVRLPHSLIFWKLWLFFVFKFVVVLLLVV